MCKCSQPQRSPQTVDAARTQQSCHAGLHIKNTFLNFDVPVLDAIRRRALSEPAQDLSVSDPNSTSGPQEEDCEDSWPETPVATPRARSEAIVLADSVFKAIGCVNKVIQLMTAHNGEELCDMALNCLPSDITFFVSTPQWSRELHGHEQVCSFLRQFVVVLQDLKMHLQDVIHPQRAGQPTQWRASCSAVQQSLFMPMFPVASRFQFQFESSAMKGEDGNTTWVHWRLSSLIPANLYNMGSVQQTQQPCIGFMQVCVRNSQMGSVSTGLSDEAPRSSRHSEDSSSQSDGLASNVLVHAERAQLAAASLRALAGLEVQESKHATSKGNSSKDRVLPRRSKAAQAKVIRAEDPLAAVESSSQPTTVIIRNIPVEYTRSMLLDMLNSAGFDGKYNFVYLPRDFERSFGLGYAFVNFATSQDAEQVRQNLHGFSAWEIPSHKICEVGWSSRQQGLAEQVKRYRNSPVMHESVPDEYKPMLFNNGRRVAFPPPTHLLKKPRGMASW